MPLELPITDPILQFTALLGVAMGVQLMLRRTVVPPLVGLLLAGMLLGPGASGVLPRGELIELLAAVGLAYVMFIAGLEVDLRVLRSHGRETAEFGVLLFVASLAPTMTAALLMEFGWRAALLLGALISSHTLLVLPMLHRMELTGRRSVTIAIGGTIVTDTLALILLAITVQTRDGSLLTAMLPLGLLVALVGLAWWVVPGIARWVLDRPNASRAEKALFILVVLLALASAAELIGTHEILGAFMAGLSLNRVLRERNDLREHVEFVGRMLFVPLFFIGTGMLLELGVMGSGGVWMLAGLLVGLVIVGKLMATVVIGIWHGYEWRDRLLMVGITIPQAGATLAVTVTGAQLGVFPVRVVDAVVLVILITCIVGPVLTSVIAGQLRTRAGTATAAASEGEHGPHRAMEDDPSPKKRGEGVQSL